MLIPWGALARAQAAQGLIPEVSAKAIHRATLEIQIDPGVLAQDTARTGADISALLTTFRSEMQAPELGKWLHHGASGHDIIDTGLALRLRQTLGLISDPLDAALTMLADRAETPMAALDTCTTDLLLTRDRSVGLGTGGSSSTMPQKANPVAPSQISALARHGHALAQTMTAPHWDHREGPPASPNGSPCRSW